MVRATDVEEYSSEDEGYSSLEEEEAAVKGPAAAADREAIYNTEGLHDKLEEMAWTDEVPWVETQTITCGSIEQVEEVEDDLQRELVFYTQALDAAKQAVEKFQGGDIKWLRPEDYYAEMVKSDAHMLRVKEQLNYETQKIDAAEERRKQRESKRFQKQLQAERTKEKAQEKKRSIDEVSKWRKQREKSGYKEGGEFELESFNRKPKKAGERLASSGFAQKSKKRQFKDSKFGFGGRKRLQKQNTAESTADMSSYRPSTAGGKRKGGAQQRPGKARRAAGRSKK
mmetsp:Transcript_40518/g.114769  ORF Transcript_40518/g.114769 Transcript_40518/m.114769 type:complete len:284 (+) Transcript_40518:107-958(+)